MSVAVVVSVTVFVLVLHWSVSGTSLTVAVEGAR